VRELVKRYYDRNSFIKGYYKEIDQVHCHALNIEPALLQEVVSYCVLRNPLTWYQSFYGYRMAKGWENSHHIDRHCMTNNFQKFVANMLRTFPFGWYTQFCSLIVPYVDYVIPMSMLCDSMVVILEQKGAVLPKFVLEKGYNSGTGDYNYTLSPSTIKRFERIEARSFARLVENNVSKFWHTQEIEELTHAKYA